MMATLNDEFNLRDEYRERQAEMTLTVRYVVDWRFKLGLMFVHFGCWLMGMICKVKEEP